MIWAIERLRVFLIAIKFTVFTDCEALVYLNAHKTTQPQVVRWSATLADYDCEIKHRKGENMRHVDALSRAPVESEAEAEELERAHVYNILMREEEILIHQRVDDRLKDKIQILDKPEHERTKYDKSEVRDYKLRQGILYKVVNRGGRELELYVVPAQMRKALAIKYHDLGSHFGIDKVMARMQNCYYFPKMRTYLKRHISQCLECILSKKKSGQRDGELHPIPPGKRPFATVHVDHVGPFITSSRGSKYIWGHA